MKVPWGSYSIAKDLGVLALSRHLVSLDAILCGLIGVDPEKVSYIELGERFLASTISSKWRRRKHRKIGFTFDVSRNKEGILLEISPLSCTPNQLVPVS